MPGIRKISPVLVVVAIIASIFFASPCTAVRPPAAVDAAAAGTKPLVENLPSSPAAQEFIRTCCKGSVRNRPEAVRICDELLLPYATSINGSYSRASIAITTVMVSKLTTLAKHLASHLEYNITECLQVVNGTISGAKEPLEKLSRLDAIGDDKVDATNPDWRGACDWITGVHRDFQKCWNNNHKNFMDETIGGAGYSSDYSIYVATGVICSPRPYWDSSPASPDGTGPDTP